MNALFELLKRWKTMTVDDKITALDKFQDTRSLSQFGMLIVGICKSIHLMNAGQDREDNLRFLVNAITCYANALKDDYALHAKFTAAFRHTLEVALLIDFDASREYVPTLYPS
jgi:hypothetical protein